MRKTGNLFIIVVLAGLFSCKKSNTQTETPSGFSKTPQQATITGGTIPEASGIADSKANPGYLWVEEDSGNPADIYLLGHDGRNSKTIPLENAENHDWEDIALGAGPVAGVNYIYLGDIGDNNLSRDEYLFYRFEEPLMSVDKVSEYNKIPFTYPDGAHDAEAFIVDAKTRDIFVITKTDDKSRIYRLSYPQDTLIVNTAEYVSDLAFNGVVSAAISPDNTELIVKTYTTLYYYTRDAAETIATTLARTPSTLSYQLEVQGEAVCFAGDNTGFYTFSEIRDNIAATLDFYKRN
jgi:hypothetical protein